MTGAPDLLVPDRGEIERFARLLFPYADSGTFVSLRAFDQFDRGVPPVFIRGIYVNGNLDALIEAAARAAEDAANNSKPVVFAPPICTFTNPDRARTEDLANGLVLSVELDDGDPEAARRWLEGLIGPATAIVASGGTWTNPGTGEVHAKLHLHWRLSEPTRMAEDHAKLRLARDLASRIVGADPTGKPIAHPYRWPGSWNQKAKPVLARLVHVSDAAEIHLTEALDALSDAIELAGLAEAEPPRSGTSTAPVPLLRSAMDAIPNPGTEIHYDTWIRLGYACWRAFDGSDDGFDAWDSWSRKSEKYDAGEQEAAWKRIGHAIEGSTAPRKVGAGTIFFYAKKVGWQRSEPEPRSTPDDRGYGATGEPDAGGAADPPSMVADSFAPTQPSEGIIPLGYDRGTFFYLSRSSRQIHALTADQHTKKSLMAMASVEDYWQRTKFISKKGNIVWDQAIDWLMTACRAVGVYNPDRMRGRGAWFDAGRAVLHLGDRLIVDGVKSPIMLAGSKHVYEAALPMLGELPPPLSTTEAHKLVDICDSLRWEKPIHGRLLAGFLAVAPICGGLAWRPNVWLTGPTSAGKTWVNENIIAVVLRGVALLVQSNTTEAGIRQALGSAARPVIFEEAEAEDGVAAQRMKAVLDLIRQSSSESGGKILKGTKDHAVRTFSIRSCFVLVSINVSVQSDTDESRISVLVMLPHNSDPVEFSRLNALVQATLTPEFSAGLVLRSARLLPVIRANAETFARAVAIKLRSKRAGDQLGTLLAGAYSLHSERRITTDEAEAYVETQQWEAVLDKQAESNEAQLLARITQHRVRAAWPQGGTADVTLGRLIAAANGGDATIPPDVADMSLRDYGLRFGVIKGIQGAGVYFSTGHPALKDMLRAMPWAAGWGRALARLKGAARPETSIRFGPGHKAKAVWVPLSTIDPGEDEAPIPPGGTSPAADLA